jgi:hypothetical protein
MVIQSIIWVAMVFTKNYCPYTNYPQELPLPCNKVYFKHQVDNFAIACKEERLTNIIFCAIDFDLQMPIK